MERLFGIIVGLGILVYAIAALPGACNRVRQDVGLKPLDPPDVGISYTPPLVPITIEVDNNLRLTVSYGADARAGGITFGFSVSPKPVRKLVVVLGDRRREYDVQGTVRIAIPNTLSGRSSIEWDDDAATVTVPEPGNLRFKDE